MYHYFGAGGDSHRPPDKTTPPGLAPFDGVTRVPPRPDPMRHFSCDACGKNLTPGEDARYIVRMETYPAADSRGLTEADLDRDHLDAMADMLEELEAAGPTALEHVATRRTMEFDLCPACHGRFTKDPLGREAGRKLQLFSKN